MQYHDANLLADEFEGTHEMTRYYTSLMKMTDPFKEREINGQKFNSLAWIIAHLAWAEDTLVLRGTGGERSEFRWLKHYAIGSEGTLHETNLHFKELLDARKIIHAKTMNHLRSLSNEDLGKENSFGWEFAGSKTNRSIIQHANRHEAMHAGQIAWLVKINGIKGK